MRAKSLTVGLSLAAAGVVTPLAALAQAPAAPPPAAPAAPAPAAPAAPAPAAPGAAPAAPAPAPEAPPPAAAAPEAAPAAAAEPAAAEPPPPLATITGYIDGAYHANMSQFSNDYAVPLRSYDSVGGNSFLLHAASVGIAHSFSPEASGYIRLDFGSDAMFNNIGYTPAAVGVQVTPGDPTAVPPTTETRRMGFGIPADVREAYGMWTPGDFTLKAGKFVTMNGIEVVDTPLNPTITRGFLFGLAEPVTHTGVKAQYTIAGGIAHVGAGIVNGWDNIIDTNNKKTILFNADVIPNNMFRAQLSGSWGAEQPGNDENPRTTIDLTGAVTLDNLVLNFQGLYGAEGRSGFIDATGLPQDNNWWGATIQPVFTMDMFSLGGRVEYFADKHGGRSFAGAVDDVKLLNFTITPGITPTKGFTLRAEYRVDAVLGAKIADTVTNPAAPTMVDNKEVLNGKSSQHTIAIGAHYMF
jgi:hypothetical protein